MYCYEILYVCNAIVAARQNDGDTHLAGIMLFREHAYAGAGFSLHFSGTAAANVLVMTAPSVTKKK
jgi:hypothetical protein